MANNIVPVQGKTEVSKVRLELTTVADDRELPIYISGDFNNWNAAEEQFRFKKISPTEYQLEVTIAPGSPAGFTYKYNRGSWEDVETDRYGNEVSRRILCYRMIIMQAISAIRYFICRMGKIYTTSMRRLAIGVWIKKWQCWQSWVWAI